MAKKVNTKKKNKGQLKLPIWSLSAEEIAKLTIDDLFEADPVDLYIAIRDKKITKFPDKYWSQNHPEYLDRVKSIMQYLFHDVLGWSKLQIENEISCAVFKKHKLVGLYDSFSSSTIKLLNSITDYQYSVTQITSYDKKISSIRRDLEWFVDKLVNVSGIKSANVVIPTEMYRNFNVYYFIDLRYFNPELPLKDILTNLHPELLRKYFTLKGTLRKGVTKEKK